MTAQPSTRDVQAEGHYSTRVFLLTSILTLATVTKARHNVPVNSTQIDLQQVCLICLVVSMVLQPIFNG